MKIKKSELDIRICDHYNSSLNPQTYREYIRDTEQHFEIEPADIDSWNAKKINWYLDWLDDLWLK